MSVIAGGCSLAANCWTKMWASMVWCSPLARVMALVATLAVSMQTMVSQQSGLMSGRVAVRVDQGFQTTVVLDWALSTVMRRLRTGSSMFTGTDGVEVGAIGFAGEFEERVGLAFLFEVVGLVEVFGVGEADDGDLLGVADGEVGVEGFFEVERLAALIVDGELKAELGAEGDLVSEGEVVVAEGAAGVGWAEGEGEMKVVAGEGSEGEGPLGDAGEAVGGAVGARVVGGCGASAEPGKDDGDAAADGFAGGEERALREEEYGLLAGGLPLRDVRALEVELGDAGGRGDVGADEALLGLGEGEDAGDSELVGECLEIHRRQCSGFRRVGR